MAIVRWDPFAMMRWPSVWDDENWDTGANAGNMDIYETENEVVVQAHVPGVKDDKVEITFEKGVLWIRADETEEETKEKKYYRKASRSFSYKVAVPGNIDLRQDPKATIENGVVKVAFKKAEEAKPKKIQVTKQSK